MVLAGSSWRDAVHVLPGPGRQPDGVSGCADAEEAHAFMHSDAFAANPIGVEIDPDALLAQYRSGAPAETLLSQPAGPAAPIPREHGLA